MNHQILISFNEISMVKDTGNKIYHIIWLCIFLCMGCSSESEPKPTSPNPSTHAPLIALTPTEYNNTIRDLFGMPSNSAQWPQSPAISNRLSPLPVANTGVFGVKVADARAWPWDFPEEAGVDGFEGMEDGQYASPYQVESTQKAAMHYAGFALVSPIFFTCKTWSTLPKSQQEECGWKSIERFVQRAWRRPLTTKERTRLKTFWDTNVKTSTPEEAIALTVGGILQSPAFAFRTHNTPTLNNWEMASRLSYLLWDTMPDSQLFAAAAKGTLNSADGVEAQARRLLDDPRARTAIIHFHKQWLDVQKIQNVSPARRAYGPLFGLEPYPPLDTTGDGAWPATLSPVRHSMEAELSLFMERTIFDGAGTLSALLTDNHGYMSSATAPIYAETTKRLPGPTVTYSYGVVSNSIGTTSTLKLYPVTFDPTKRAGVLTSPAVLALGAYAVHPGPIIRGKRILERLACQHMGTPPPGAEAQLPADAADAMRTNRQRTQDATSAMACSGCHNTINPPGFAFEHYDALGRWRAKDNGQGVNASGKFSFFTGESFDFSDGVALSRQLSTSETVRACYVLRWARYATGVALNKDDPHVQSLTRQFQSDDHVKRLLLKLVRSDLFRHQTQKAVTP